MREFELVIRDAVIVDGTGSPPRRGDLAIRDGLIAAVGEVSGSGAEEIDAQGNILTPGFVDIHTHYDGQVTWESRMAPSSSHGVTSVVMGNCGVGFAPCRPEQRDMLISLMEGVEDIPEVVMRDGLPWTWETFGEYLDVVGQGRYDVDVAAQVPHSAIRVYAMGERGARQEPASAEDLALMRELVREGVQAGALGVTTSRNMMHRTKAGDLAPSLHSEEAEFLALAEGLRDAGRGVFQMIPDVAGDARAEFAIMRRIAEAAGRPFSFSLLQMPVGDPAAWRQTLDLLSTAQAEGVEMLAQVAPRPVGMLYGLDLSFHPFSLHPSFRPLLDLPLAEKVAAMRRPQMRAQLLSEQPEDTNPVSVKIVKAFRFAYELGDPPVYDPPLHLRIDRLAAEAGLSAEEYAYDRLLTNEGQTLFYQPGANYRDGNLEAAAEMLGHPRTILGLGDGGAHYGMICDASFPTYFLQHWVRDADVAHRVDLPAAVRALTRDPACAVGLRDRGLIAPDHKADLNLIDLQRLRLHAPTVVRDLPSGGRRLRQLADGYLATIVSGQITYRDGVATGALPGRLVRSRRAA